MNLLYDRFGDVQEAVGVVGYPLAASKCESQAHAILRFTSGHTATLCGHFNSIPMKPRPFFHIFGDQVRGDKANKITIITMIIF